MSYFNTSIDSPKNSDVYYIYKFLFFKYFANNKNIKTYAFPPDPNMNDFFLIIEKLFKKIHKSVSEVSFQFLTEEEFNSRTEYYSQIISRSYSFLFDFLNIEQNKLSLENYLSDYMNYICKDYFQNIINACFENIFICKNFIVSKEIKLKLLKEINPTNYPIYFSFLETSINTIKSDIAKTFFEEKNKNSENPPITKINTENTVEISFDDSAPTKTKKEEKIVKKDISTEISKERQTIADYMVNFDFDTLSERRQKVLNTAYSCLEWQEEEPIPFCLYENVILFIGLNKDHPEIESFIEWAEKQIFVFVRDFSIDFVSERLSSTAKDGEYDTSANWFSFYSESPYKKLIEFNESVMVYDKELFSLNKQNLLVLLNEYDNIKEIEFPTDAEEQRSEEIYNIFQYYFSLGTLVEPGNYFSKSKNRNSDLFDLWNEQILGLSREDYIRKRDLYRKISVSNFVCSNSFPYCVSFVKYCYQNVVTKKEKQIYGQNGQLTWYSCVYVSYILSKNKKEVKDLKKLKPADIVYSLTGHFLILVDVIFEEDEYVTFYMIHGNGWGYQPLLKKYTEGVLLDCENTPMSDYVKYEYWNESENDSAKRRLLISEVFDTYKFYSILE